MRARDMLVEISNDARGWLKAWAGDFNDEDAARTVPGGPHPLLWQLGHLACVEDDVAALFGSGGTLMPEAVRAVCASGGPSPTGETRFPSLAESWNSLEATHTRLLALLDGVTEADLDRPPSTPNRFFRTLGQAIYEAALHENYHVGEIGALRKALGKPRIG